MGLRHLALSALFLCSCTPRAIEMRALNSVNPEPLQQENHLVCPRIPSTSALLPPAPYDEELGDCALVGQAEEIEAWLTELERIAASCRANRETNWASVLEVREDLDSQIDRLEDLSLGPGFMHAACPSHGLGEPAEPLEGDRPPTHYYTDWLKGIGEDVGQYCTMIDELVKPLWQACDEINFYQDCQAPNPEQYHSIINGGMNAAEIDYNFTDFFYTNALQAYGWVSFRTHFNEASIDCTPIQAPAPIPAPIAELLENAKCRKGAGSAYAVMSYLQQGSIATIVGRNANWSWWMIQPGDQQPQCWVWSALVTTSDDTRQVLFVASPPLPTLTLAPQPHAPASAGCWVTTLQNPNGVCLPRACTPNDFPGTPCTP